MKNAVYGVDWTCQFFTCENIAHTEFYLQGLLPKILAIYTIKTATIHQSLGLITLLQKSFLFLLFSNKLVLPFRKQKHYVFVTFLMVQYMCANYIR